MGDFTDKLEPASPSGPSVLAAERKASNIDIDQLAKHLLSRDGFLDRQKRILAVLEPIPYFCKKNQLNIARPDRFQLSLARAKTLRRLSLQHAWSREDYIMADYLMDEMSPYALHGTMFVTSIREQSNPEQKAYWLPKVEDWEIIGCYAQTELGHGSNVKGIECLAIWDTKSKDFIIHSPTLTASKWWNGALGRTANHAIVVAQLIVPDPKSKTGKRLSYGPHQFVVQIRDMKTHQPLKGIVIGDIGPKYGYPGMDNGYMLFHQHRVPHSALLSRYSSLDPETSAYVKPVNSGLVYGTLTFIRAQIIMHARLILARAVTVAVRYLAIRRQFPDRDSKDPHAPEHAVLDYPTVQIRVLPLVATAFALHYTGEAMYHLYNSTRKSIETTGDFSSLAEMHATSSGLKSLCTTLAADGIETCRRAMGGHGFSGGSGMIPLNNEYLSKPTVEGDNWMITQQTAAYLIKQMTNVVERPGTKNVAAVDAHFKHYVSTKSTSVFFDIFGNDGDLVAAFQRRASHLAYQVYQARQKEGKPWTSLMIYLHRLSRAYSESLLVSNFHKAVCASTPNPPLTAETHAHIKVLFRLFTLFTLEASASEFLLCEAISHEQLQQVTPHIQTLMTEIRPHAVSLVDAWSIPDYLLESALGSYDGDVYKNLYRKAHKENPLNRLTFNPDWKTEEIVMGEGAAVSKQRLEALALGSVVPEQPALVKASL